MCLLAKKGKKQRMNINNYVWTWILLKQRYNKIVSSNPHPKGDEHYTMVPWQIKYNGGRLSPTPGKWFLVGISDSEAGYRRQGIRHFYVTQEDSVKDLPGIDDLQDECDEILQYTVKGIYG